MKLFKVTVSVQRYQGEEWKTSDQYFILPDHMVPDTRLCEMWEGGFSWDVRLDSHQELVFFTHADVPKELAKSYINKL